MSRDFHLPGRSPVIATEGMAATSHPLATLVAVDILRAGGTAADAAVAAIAALGVVEPHMTGIGGDGFCLVAKAGQPVWGYNGSGRAAATASCERFVEQGVRAIANDSVHAVTVPGAADAWESIVAAHGRLGLERVLAPAIKLARDGIPVAPRVAADWEIAAPRIRKDPGTARHCLVNGAVPRVGDVVKFPALADTLETVARKGARAFYEGPIADDIVATLKARGGLLTQEDFARHHGDAVTPISTNYRGTDIVEIPPNGQGLAALVLLNILERFDFSGLDPISPERLHILLEAARLAYGVRDTHVSDPRTMTAPVPALLDKAFAAGLARHIDRSKRVPLPSAPGPVGNTVLVTVVDRDRMAVSMINSLFSSFGSAIATERTGVVLHDRGACFVVEPGHPNAIGPSKRPLHTIIPALAMRDGRCQWPFGVMGSYYQSLGHAYVTSNRIDYGMDPQEAIDAPRVFFDRDVTLYERGLPPATVEGLTARGHRMMVRPQPLGGSQMIEIDWSRGVLIGGSDPRKDGCAIGY